MTAGVPAPTLPRELPDISEAVRTVPPPPIPELLSPSKIRVADPDGADAEMVAEWMNRPHLAATWGYDWPSVRSRTARRHRGRGAGGSRPGSLGTAKGHR